MSNISLHKFSIDTFKKLASQSSGLVPEQVKYLARYCESLGAKTIVFEDFYIDRHYVDEYALYYSRMLSHPKNSVKRLHVFSSEFSQVDLKALLESSFKSEAAKTTIEDKLNETYLGFCVIRPIASAPIGRTILRPLPNKNPHEREIIATNVHIAHIANLKLQVRGLAFQQQDAAVGACATAALWSALTRVARHDGIRAPTPAEISEAAEPVERAGARKLLAPNGGLTLAQLSQATRVLNFSTEIISARGRPETFMLALHTYLQSGIPVVLALKAKGLGHAVTAVGFQMHGSENPNLHTTFNVRSANINKIYVHDDRMGPYARAYLQPFFAPSSDPGQSGILFEIEWEDGTESWLLDSALVPLYPKLRLSMRSMVSLAELLAASIEKMVGTKLANNLRVDFRYERSGQYLSKLSGRVMDGAVAADTVTAISLSRWCGVIRWFINDVELIEFVYDTTDVVRDVSIQNAELLKLVVGLNNTHRHNAAVVARGMNVPFL